MRFGWLLAATLAACYQPTLHEGAPCGPGATCPTGQECRAGTCFFTTTPSDASGDDGPEDTSMITVDAAPDAALTPPWGAPVELTSLETTADGEDDPSITADKLTVVLKATPTGQTDHDLQICTRTALTDSFVCTPLAALNSTADEDSPEISPNGSTIWFVSDRTTAGNGDVWTSTQTGGVWAAPTMDANLSAGNVGDVAISPDGLTAVTSHGTSLYLFTRTTTTSSWGTGVSHSELVTGLTSPAAPSITNGAALIYFHAMDPRDIYASRRLGNGNFKAATPVTELNDAALRDAAPFVLQTDDYMIFEREYDIFETTR
ncbi:MAG TPA: hypothetical protein VL326_34920 [Kofleriaceae bacterium]|nr:hypothetical protein [Kofleriaceae bacterium]